MTRWLSVAVACRYPVTFVIVTVDMMTVAGGHPVCVEHGRPCCGPGRAVVMAALTRTYRGSLACAASCVKLPVALMTPVTGNPHDPSRGHIIVAPWPRGRSMGGPTTLRWIENVPAVGWPHPL